MVKGEDLVLCVNSSGKMGALVDGEYRDDLFSLGKEYSILHLNMNHQDGRVFGIDETNNCIYEFTKEDLIANILG